MLPDSAGTVKIVERAGQFTLWNFVHKYLVSDMYQGFSIAKGMSASPVYKVHFKSAPTYNPDS